MENIEDSCTFKDLEFAMDYQIPEIISDLQETREMFSVAEYVDNVVEFWELKTMLKKKYLKEMFDFVSPVGEDVASFLDRKLSCGQLQKREKYKEYFIEPLLKVWDSIYAIEEDKRILIMDAPGMCYSLVGLEGDSAYILAFSGDLFDKDKGMIQFTIFHELAHFLLHRGYKKIGNREEGEANYLAWKWSCKE